MRLTNPAIILLLRLRHLHPSCRLGRKLLSCGFTGSPTNPLFAGSSSKENYLQQAEPIADFPIGNSWWWLKRIGNLVRCGVAGGDHSLSQSHRRVQYYQKKGSTSETQLPMDILKVQFSNQVKESRMSHQYWAGGIETTWSPRDLTTEMLAGTTKGQLHKGNHLKT